MSAYNSLYIRITIKEEKLHQFFQEKPGPQPVNEDWLKWWDNQEMYDKKPLEHIPHYHAQSNRAILDQLINDRDFGCSEQYDAKSGRWTFLSIFFSENYIEILPMLAMLKNLAAYQEAGGTGVAFIYDFCWGCKQVMAYLAFANQHASFMDYTSPAEIDQAVLKEANSILDTALVQFNRQFEERQASLAKVDKGETTPPIPSSNRNPLP